MNKKTKGAIAAGAAALILAGGAGTFATWNDSESLPGGTVIAGKLALETVGGPGVWKDQANNTITLDSYKAAPGDQLTYTTTVKVIAVGDNLAATLKANAGSITGDLASQLDLTTTATLDGATLATNNSGVAITKAQNNKDIVVSVAVKFKGTAGNATMEKTAALTDLTLSLDQNPVS
ncbi:alternate-type signal peptide domain-containing protein [Prescottella equi]